MDPSLQAETVFSNSQGASIVATFGAVWLGWGLLIVRALTLLRGIAIAVVALILLAGSSHFIRKGKELRAQYPPLPKEITHRAGKWLRLAEVRVWDDANAGCELSRVEQWSIVCLL